MVPNDDINTLIAASVHATEEAILNAMLAAETLTGSTGTPFRRSRTIGSARSWSGRAGCWDADDEHINRGDKPCEPSCGGLRSWLP
jgi:Peptidase family S58